MIGCARSHRDLIQMSADEGVDSLLVFEDDVVFDDGLNEKFTEWTKEVPDNWDMLYFGGNHNVRSVEDKQISPHVLKITGTFTTHAYAIRSTMYQMILKRLENIDLDVDIIYTEFQADSNAYCFTPRLAWQRAGWSDILDVHADYGFLKDDNGCHKHMK